MDKSISRRSFLKGSIVMAAGAFGSYALAGCAPNTKVNKTDSNNTTTAVKNTDMATGSMKVALHRGYAAAHGDKCFTQIVVAVDETGGIVAVNVDDYQFLASSTEGITPVPNSDSDFAEGITEGYMLVSKADNSDVYSKIMIEKGGATRTWGASMTAIEAYAVGKTPDELKSVAIDAISGATLVDAPNYLAAIAQIAQDNSIVSKGSYEPGGSALKIGRVNEGIHGTKAFGNTVSLVQDDIIVAASIDEFQFVAAADGVVSVPNSDKTFGADYYAEGQVLTSKSANNTAYSESMAEKAGATTSWLASVQAIQSAIAGQKISAVSIDGPDAVSGATLAGTADYAKAAVEAAKSA